MFTRLELVGRRAACTLALFAPLLAGCDRPVKAPIQLADVSDTPQGHLKNVMRRLEHALKIAKPAADSGVKSERKCAYELIEPANEGGDYTAEVTIQTSRALAPALAAKLKPKPKPETQAQPTPPAEGDAAIQPIGDPANPNDAKAQPPADPTISVEEAVYKLAYKNHRWELVDPPQKELPETESICFQYALSDG